MSVSLSPFCFSPLEVAILPNLAFYGAPILDTVTKVSFFFISILFAKVISGHNKVLLGIIRYSIEPDKACIASNFRNIHFFWRGWGGGAKK